MSETPDIPAAPATPSGKGWLRLVPGVLLMLVAAASLGGFALYQIAHPTTNDISVQAHVLGVAARVDGPVVRKHFTDNQEVRKGDLLFEIDPSTYQAAYDRALAQRNLAMQEVQQLVDNVRSGESLVEQRRTTLANAEQTLQRYQGLAAIGGISKLEIQNQQALVKSSQDALNKAVADLDAARAQLTGSVESNPRIRAAEAALREAELHLSYTRVHAPEDGYVTNENVTPGTYVTAGQMLFALVVKDQWWVNARFKETQVRVIRPGDRVRVFLKMYPGREFEGVVQGVGRGIYQWDGATVDLLPQVDPTVDWVRLANRFVVRVNLKDPGPSTPLRIGATGVVIVDAGRLE